MLRDDRIGRRLKLKDFRRHGRGAQSDGNGLRFGVQPVASAYGQHESK